MRPGRTNDLEQVTRILERHLSPIHARSVLRHALSEHKLSANEFTIASLRKINGSLQRGLRLFTTEVVCTRAIADILASFESQPVKIEPCSISIDAEIDISRARSAARQLCEQVGAKSFVIQKVTTIVSELARNIVSYTTGGTVDISWKETPRQRMVIRAVDTGPGISNLVIVLSGEYQSKTGLGRGLVGTKRLSDDFDIDTGPNGTRVVAEINL